MAIEMDSHHEQVEAARRRSQGEPPKLYFGYSTILDRQAFDEWKHQHGYGAFALPKGEIGEALDVELTFDFPSRFWDGRVAGLADKKGSSVFGMLWEIPGVDWPIIQHKEGAVTGMCIERSVLVRVGTKTVSATAFTTRPERASFDGPVSARFVEALLRGARAAGLPESYLAKLRLKTA